MVLLLVILLTGLFACDDALRSCPASQPTSLNLSIDTRRNLTGHWIVSVGVGKETGVQPSERRMGTGVTVNIAHGTTSCDNFDSVELIATATVPPTLPTGYEVINGLGYYKLHTTAATWDDARDTCVREGGHLIVINSVAEADVVKTFFARKDKIVGEYTQGYFQVGFHDRYTEGQYVTVTGTPLSDSGYMQWDHGQPTSGSENCGVATPAAKYHDSQCHFKFGYICEISEQ